MESLFVPYQPSTELPATRVLVLAPHPDDEVFGCGGAIMRHVELGVAVDVVIVTDGAHGADPAQAQAIHDTRRSESTAAAAVLGYGTPRFLDYADRGLSYGEQLIGTLLDLCRTSGADLIYAPSVFEMHPDHRVLGMAALETLRRLGGNTRLAFYEVGIPLKPTHLLDISALMPRKQEAMACFVSQLARQRYDLDVAALNRYRTYTLPETVTAAEAFMLVTAQDADQDPLGLYRSEYQRQRALGVPLVPQDCPLVSVIVRSMDRDSLCATLDSVALQTYANIEVVLVNAGGRPHRDRGEWCGRFPLRLIEPGTPLGRSAAANAGMEAARGELLIFLDDDDLFLPHHIAGLQRCLNQAGANVVAAYAGIACIDPEGREHHRYQRPFDRLWLAVENYIPIHALLFRRAALESGARFDTTLDHCEDWDFWLQLQDQGDFVLLPEVGGIYQVAPGTGSGLWGNLQLARAASLKIYRKRMPLWDDDLLWRLFELTHYKTEYERTARGAVELREQGATLGRLLVRLQQRCEQAETERETLRQQLTALHGSSSWRLTAPLRTVATVLGRQAPLPPPPVDPPAEVPANPALLRLDDPLQGVLQWLAPGSRILLAGGGEDEAIRRLHERQQYRLALLEDDIATLEALRPHCETLYATSVDALQWPVPAAAQTHEKQRFAAVLALGTLERLRDPWQALMRMREVAGEHGCVIATLQNAGHAAVAGCLAAGQIDYGHTGPLQRARLRYFALGQMEALFAQAGLKIIAAGYVCKAPTETPLALQWQALPRTLREALATQPQAAIYQVALKAVPATHPDSALVLGALSAP